MLSILVGEKERYRVSEIQRRVLTGFVSTCELTSPWGGRRGVARWLRRCGESDPATTSKGSRLDYKKIERENDKREGLFLRLSPFGTGRNL